MSEESYNNQDPFQMEGGENNSNADVLVPNVATASAPPADDFIVVGENAQKTSNNGNNDNEAQEEMSKLLLDITNSVETSLKNKVVAEADSSTSSLPHQQPEQQQEKPAEKPKADTKDSKKEKSGCTICPYYALGEFFLFSSFSLF